MTFQYCQPPRPQVTPLYINQFLWHSLPCSSETICPAPPPLPPPLPHRARLASLFFLSRSLAARAALVMPGLPGAMALCACSSPTPNPLTARVALLGEPAHPRNLSREGRLLLPERQRFRNPASCYLNTHFVERRGDSVGGGAHRGKARTVRFQRRRRRIFCPDHVYCA